VEKLSILVVFSALLLVPVGMDNAFAQIQPSSCGGTLSTQTDEDDVIFDGGTADLVFSRPLDDPDLIFAEDFQLQEATSLRDVHFDVFQPLPDVDTVFEFTYAVYADSIQTPGIPGVLIQEGEGINEHKEFIQGCGAEDSRYWFDLDKPLILAAGTTYWIELFATNTPNTGSIEWWTTTPGFGNECAATLNDGTTWLPCLGFHLNLVLTGSPEQLPVGGELIQIETTSLLLAGAQSFSWMIPVILSGIGIGLFVVSRKSE